MLPPLMARRVRQMEMLDLGADSARVDAPTLVITGERQLDRVVPVESTMGYIGKIRGARHALLERTGHLGVLMQPQRFAALVSEFVDANNH